MELQQAAKSVQPVTIYTKQVTNVRRTVCKARLTMRLGIQFTEMVIVRRVYLLACTAAHQDLCVLLV